MKQVIRFKVVYSTVKRLNFKQHSLNFDSSPSGWF